MWLQTEFIKIWQSKLQLLISIILLIPLSKYLTHASNSQLDSEFNKQRGIFNKYGSTWPDLASIDDSSSDDSDTKINPELRLLEELARIRYVFQSYPQFGSQFVGISAGTIWMTKLNGGKLLANLFFTTFVTSFSESVLFFIRKLRELRAP